VFNADYGDRMGIYRLTCSFARDSIFAKDAIVMTPHFQVNGALQDPDQLCEDLATALDAWDSGTGQTTVRAYDAESAPPNYPLGEAIRNQGAAPSTTGVREVAICLSYFAGQTRPRRRGRLYVSCSLAGLSTSAARPSLANRQKVADLVPIFATLGGVNVDWVVWSRADSAARKVSNWWVDDAYDIQRSRGLVATTRLEGTTGG
jgi:hypothetical protein